MPTAELTLECTKGHRVRLTVPYEHGVLVPPVEQLCPECGGWQHLVSAVRGEVGE